ncbi:MAG: Anti-sigma factor [Sphingobacteriales bacterium]|nr:Anti-sigma factor [Sphingobacteriales bacterium]
MPISQELFEAIESYINQCATEQEIELVNEWYHSFDDREVVIYSKESNLKHKVDLMIRERLAKTTGLSHFAQVPGKTIQMRESIKWVAAAVVLLVSAFSLYFYKTNQDVSPTANDISPAKNVAQLTLANGRKILLSDAVKGKLDEEAGVRIEKTENGQLVYTVIGSNNSGENNEAFNTIETPRGGKYKVNLPDGTQVWLNAASSLKYPTRFTGNLRTVELDGEAYFEVAHDKAHPFKVITDKQIVEVLGTHFNLNSYADESSVKTTLLEGSVKVLELKTKQTQLLKPGEQAVLETGSLEVKQADLSLEMAWKNGEFIFSSNDFRAEMRKISRWYDVDIVYSPDAPDDFQLGGFVSRSKNISEVLDLIELTGKVHFKVEGRRVLVTK